MLKIERTLTLSEIRKVVITQLWNAEYPEQLNFSDEGKFEAFLNRVSDKTHYLLLSKNGEIKGWLMAFTRNDERWFSVIVDGKEKQKGYGTQLLDELKINETEINGWVVDSNDYIKNNGEKYHSPIGFYEKNGFSVLQDVRWNTENLSTVKINWKKSL
jgi:hypothetical protein